LRAWRKEAEALEELKEKFVGGALG